MNVENAKKIKLPDAKKLMILLEEARMTRLQKRRDPHESNSQDDLQDDVPDSQDPPIPTIDTSKTRNNPANSPTHSNPRPSMLKIFCRRVCCCLKYQVVPDATHTIEK